MTLNNISLVRLQNVHPDLVRLVKAIDGINFEVITGYRDKATQEQDYNLKRSHAHYGQSAHNFIPSLAIDLAPLPIDWNNFEAFVSLSNAVLATAHKLSIDISWGGSWKFRDVSHYELTNWKQLAASKSEHL